MSRPKIVPSFSNRKAKKSDRPMGGFSFPEPAVILPPIPPMHLVRLELQGFKTFAKKTSLSFLPPKGPHTPITAIVGPNGSGKSNLADAMRWVLGEQSLKALRGKASEDVIFSGSEGRGRAGFAEVAITFDNTDKTMPLDFGEIIIARRLYRDGSSEYLVNGAAARLSDIQLLLAQANVGQRSYSVVSQGMVDHILVAPPEERKAFFDDATGVRPLQIKRHEALLKLKRTHENLAEMDLLLGEIEPRLRSLKRQANRLEERAEVEQTLRGAERAYYGTLWWQLADQIGVVKTRAEGEEKRVADERQTVRALEARVNALEGTDKKEEKADDGFTALQEKYREAQRERSKIRDAYYETQKQIELAKVRAQSSWAPLPLLKIIEELTALETNQSGLFKRIKAATSIEELRAIDPELDAVIGRTKTLSGRLQRPAPEDLKPDPVLVKRLGDLEAQRKTIEAALVDLEQQLEARTVQERQMKSELFGLQRELRERERALHLIENQRNAAQIDIARLEERRANLAREMEEHVKATTTMICTERPTEGVNTDQLYPEIQRLRTKLELIGGIDPETVREYEETKARFEFLDGQVKDLREAIAGTEKVLNELDEDIRTQSERAFHEINKEFQKFFKLLFGGGSCSLVRLTRDDLESEAPVEAGAKTVAEEERHHEEEDATDSIRAKIRAYEDRVAGIDIQATPPGKRLKSLNLLSGGERALTSIALLSAIMAVNPSPFVVLDEVDAALDESNTVRFANILHELAKLTQFIVITHNRATMEKADLLYGVTMGDDGVSALLSVKLEDVAGEATARR